MRSAAQLPRIALWALAAVVFTMPPIGLLAAAVVVWLGRRVGDRTAFRVGLVLLCIAVFEIYGIYFMLRGEAV